MQILFQMKSNCIYCLSVWHYNFMRIWNCHTIYSVIISQLYMSESLYYYYCTMYLRAFVQAASPAVGGAVLIIYVCTGLILLALLSCSALTIGSMGSIWGAPSWIRSGAPVLPHYLPHLHKILTLIKWRGLLGGFSQ